MATSKREVTRRHSLRRIMLIAIGTYLVACLLAFLLQRKMMYFPDSSDVVLLRGMQDVNLEATDGTKLKATWWPGSSDVVLLILHGNAGHRGHRFSLYQPFHARGHSMFFLDYRGYGGSEGTPTEAGINMDADAAVDWLMANAAEKKIVYFGESLGSSVALSLAAHHEPAGMVLKSGGLDLGAVGQGHYPFLPVKWLMRDRFDGSDLATKIHCPALVIHGAKDRIVPMKHGRAIFDALPGKKEWIEFAKAGHNDVVVIGGTEFVDAVDTFVRGLS